MRLFVDSSNPDVWERHFRQGWVYGATTNPLILQRDKLPSNLETYRSLLAQARAIGLRELQIQATGSTGDELLESARSIAALSERGDLVVKIPLTDAGMMVGARLIGEGYRVTMTAAYAIHQMMAGTAMGADYVAPYYGRLTDSGADADAILGAMGRLARENVSAPRVLVASLRSIDQLEHLAGMGHTCFTLSPNLAEQFGCSKLSDTAAAEFERAASKT